MDELWIAVLVIMIVVVLGIALTGWAFLSVMRMIGGWIASLFNPGRGPRFAAQSHVILCDRNGCHAVNPPRARFCRRCGRQLSHSIHYPVRHAAVW